MVDRYTKVVLTIIAGTLVAIAAQTFMSSATAQLSGCTLANPCAVFNIIPDKTNPESCFETPRPCFAVSTN
jgi:hypothetical protein